jgi:hypothetical protein
MDPLLEPVPPDVAPHSIVLWNTPDWLVGVPLTWWASAWWGSFTEWCTAWDEAAFEVYARQGPLLVFRQRRTSWRWQLHTATGEFRDRANRRASWRAFLTRHPEVVGACWAAAARSVVVVNAAADVKRDSGSPACAGAGKSGATGGGEGGCGDDGG